MILIVEDNREMRRMLRSIVEHFGNDCCECEDGAEAFDAFEKHHPEWVLMDLAMRKMNGLDATRRIIARFPEAKIAIVTSYDDENLRETAAAAGAREYIVKDNLFDLRRLFAQ